MGLEENERDFVLIRRLFSFKQQGTRTRRRELGGGLGSPEPDVGAAEVPGHSSLCSSHIWLHSSGQPCIPLAQPGSSAVSDLTTPPADPPLTGQACPLCPELRLLGRAGIAQIQGAAGRKWPIPRSPQGWRRRSMSQERKMPSSGRLGDTATLNFQMMRRKRP